MTNGLEFYLTTILVYFGVNIIAAWALNLEYGEAGIPNFAFIVFQAVGAYTAGILTLGPNSSNGGFQHYILGTSLPFPLPYVVAAIVGAVVAIPIGYISVLRLRRDFQALVLLVLAIMATGITSNLVGLFNGSSGLSLIPQPLQNELSGLSPSDYQWFYVALVTVAALLTYAFIRRFTESPLGRNVRASRDNSRAAAALGKNVLWLRLLVLVVGGAIAAFSGALLATYIGVWAPNSWQYQETLVYLAAIFVGGIGNRLGVMLGVALVPILFAEVTRFIPALGRAGLSDAVQWMAIGLLIIGFLWFRPVGLIPERRRFPGGRPTKLQTLPDVASAAAAIHPVERPSGLANRASTTTPAIVLKNLRCQFGAVVAVDDVSFNVSRGEITGLIGPNGAGKSTVLGAMGGGIKARRGSIEYAGVDVCGLPPHRIARLGMIQTFQMSTEFPKLTVLENLLIGAPRQRGESLVGAMRGRRFWGITERAAVERAREWLARFRMLEKENEPAGELSGGQRRLLELMRALMAEPQVLLLDEPLAGISPAMSDEVATHLEQLRDDGMTIVMTEHELSMVERLCNSVVVMAQGSVISEGSMGDLRERDVVVQAYLSG